MSGLDPSAILLNDLVTLIDATLTLGVPTEVLQAQISVGDLLSATVLAPQNGQDLIEILGQRVIAQLPPDVHPGETLVLQVTGFSGNQILVRNLGQADPQNPPPTVNVTLIAPKPTVEAPAPPQNQQQPPVSPPREVFVAASVRQVSPPVTPQAGAPPRLPGHLDARIAAAQTSPAKTPSIQTSSAQTPPLQTPARAASLTAAAIPVRAQVQSAVQQIAQQVVRTVSDLLKTIRVPDIPLTRTAAAVAAQAPVRLPSVLQRLDAALPRESADPRVATLKTLIAFTARINPASEQTLPAQISSYVSHVVEGAEPKLQQQLQALAQTVPTELQTPQTPLSLHDRVSEAISQTVSHVASHARAAERAIAIEHDLKSLVLSLLRQPGPMRTPALTQALNETFITLTAAQLNVLSTNAQDPGTVALTLPVFYHEGGKPAQIRISKDAQSRTSKLDADNFHVAFVLDTAHLGTVAIDLQTTGRTVQIDVKTEGERAASRFAQTIDSLRRRLEDLRYRVGSAKAAALTMPAAKPSANVATPAKERGVDLRA
jgi:hypothetical protein